MKWTLTGESLFGDLLMQTPAIRCRKSDHPEDVIEYVCGVTKGSHVLLEGNRWIDRVLRPDEYVHERDAGDRVVEMDAMWAFQWGVKNGKTIAEGFGALLDMEVDYLGYDLELTLAERDRGLEMANRLGRGLPIVIVARHSASCSSNDPKVRQPNKCVSNRLWVQVAEWLIEEGFVPVAVGGKDDLSDSRYHEWPGEKLYGANIRDVAAMTVFAAGTLAVDTGIRHLAAAAGGHMYCLSGAIPLSLIRCQPARQNQRIVEEFVPLPNVTASRLIAGAKQILYGD